MYAHTLHGNPFDIAHRQTQMVNKPSDTGNLRGSLPKADTSHLTDRGKKYIRMLVDSVDKNNTSAGTVMAHLLNKFGDDPNKMKEVTDYMMEYGIKKQKDKQAKKEEG